ncbi:hypothetical protein B0J18DRAFT_369149 [Chaetomium sp. MPI-SDFR-AT-0129]|nr:hypothetical protein B0J18DRAFT_369149 [Chaetomium sp. MPI-SDFR-AT-0129]
MTKLAACVYIYRPESPTVATATVTTAPSSEDPTPASSRRTPKLIILAAWMGARDPHIAKYLVQYQALFPTAPILLLRSEARHFLRPGGNDREFVPAVPFVRSIFPGIGTSTTAPSGTSQEGGPQLLLHAWSNGGAASLHHLRAGLGLPTSGTSTGSNTDTLPPYTLLLDSSPGTFRYGPAYLAFTAGLTGRATRFLLAPVFHALCAWYWLIHVVIGRGKTGPLAVVGTALNWNGGDGDGNGNGKSVAQAELRRTYVYGEGDKLVDWRDVEAHAAEAERKGFAVRREKFEGSAHVAHVRVDADRYWRVVTETWEGVE